MRTSTKGALALALAIVVLPGLLYAFPQVAGADDGLVVLSGSMEPAFSAGDLVFVERVAASDVAVGDVVTFRLRPGSETLVTHRVVEDLGDGRFRTQGDANEEVDPWIVDERTLVGEVRFAVPWWGHLLDALRTKVGYALLVLVPGSLVVLRELLVLYRELDARDRARTEASR